MYPHNPIEILEKNKAKIIEERQIIISELDKFKKKLYDIDMAIEEYDAVIASAKKIHETKEEPEKEEDLITFRFVESHKKAIPPKECTNIINNLKYGRNGNQITIRTPTSKYLNSTWDYLVDFYERLPDIIKFTQITGINKDKRFVLTSFYESHVNFNCKIIADPDGRTKQLVKEPVIVNNDTKPMQKMIDIL